MAKIKAPKEIVAAKQALEEEISKTYLGVDVLVTVLGIVEAYGVHYNILAIK